MLCCMRGLAADSWYFRGSCCDYPVIFRMLAGGGFLPSPRISQAKRNKSQRLTFALYDIKYDETYG